MIIGFDGSRAFSKEKTGTENYSYQILLNLAKIDTENSYFVYLRPGSQVSKENWPSNFEFRVLEYHRLWTQVGLAVHSFIDPLDVLFVPAHTLPLIRKPGLKTVITVHDLGAQYLPQTHQLKQRLYLNFITKFQFKSATKLIAVSRATKADLIKKVGLDPAKIEVIYEGYNEFLFKKPLKFDQLRDILIQFHLENKKYFLFVGTIQPRKNIERIIEAFASLRGILVPKQSQTPDSEIASSGETLLAMTDVKLVLVGGKGWLSDEIYELPKKLGIEDRVKFLGRVEDEFLPALYQGAIALVFPSLFEGFGLPILEAFASSCPVITSKLSSMPEVGGEAALYVDPHKIEEIANAMMKLYQDQNLRESLVERGQQQLQKFSWEKAAKQTWEVFKKICKA